MTVDGGPPRVAVVGGGSAGYMTALAFRARRPDVEVTMIQSSRVPIIGVGESTTPVMVPFLHGYLGLDIDEFMNRVKPTWKIGVKLLWGQPSDYYFNFPFDAHGLGDSYVHSGDINSCSLGSLLMTAGSGLHLHNPDWSYQSLLPVLPYAYHLDNRRLVAHLQNRARAVGLNEVDALLVSAERNPEGGISALIADDGARFDFDLYVDCSGFASRLLGEALGTPFISFASSLFTDRAIVATVPHGGVFGPSTVAETMDAGWCWSLPQADEDHRGYVFSSQFITADEAADEMLAKNPGMSEPRQVDFTSGRRAEWWRHNVVGIGNAYGFVEPLEATALHMIVREISHLIANLEGGLRGQRVRDDLNQGIAACWDYIRGHLALHYKFNQRADTAFWRACREHTDLGVLKPVVDSALERGSFVERPQEAPDSARYALRSVTDETDLLLLGQKVVPAEAVVSMQSRVGWDRDRVGLARVACRAVGVKDSLDLATRFPELADPRGGVWYERALDELVPPSVGAGASDSSSELTKRIVCTTRW
ncbi:MAG: tryptophan halogenase family protein, partial [Pseudonocardiaceae bacterium]